VDAVFKALGDESRRTVLEALRGGPASASELAAMLPIARPGVSRHLRVLRESAWSRSERPHNFASTACVGNRSPRSTAGSIGTDRCGSNDLTHCTYLEGRERVDWLHRWIEITPSCQLRADGLA
jgi:hypothetical protein